LPWFGSAETSMWITRPALLAVLLASVASSAQAQEIKSEELYKKVLPSVMTLNVDKQGSGYCGTAFLSIRDGLAVTAWHVVKGATRVTAKFATGEEFEVSGLVDKDEKRDVALVRVKVFGRPILPALTAEPEVGSKAYVIGAPRGLDFSISDGLVSQIQAIDGVKQLQFSCPASPGNSGGPLVNNKGEVIGVVSWQFREGQNLNFAVPVTYVLGLDASLPTQPWDRVKPSETPDLKRTGASDEKLDGLYAKTYVTIFDTLTAIAYAEAEIIMKPGGFKGGVPSCVYSLKRDLSSHADALDNTTGSDPLKEKLRTVLASYCRGMADGLDLMAQAIRSAQSGGGWNSTASDLCSQSRAILARAPECEPGEARMVAVSQGVSSKLPLAARHLLGVEREPAPFNLGVKTWLNNSLGIVVVLKDGLAEKLGFRSGDQILSVKGRTLGSLSEFKCALRDNAGRKLQVTMERNSKRKELELAVPSELPTQ
jgi:S1-C subfamily serine protease